MEKEKNREEKIPTLKGMNKDGDRREFPYLILEDKNVVRKEMIDEIDREEIRNITFDSVYDKKHYRVVVSKYNPEAPIEEIFLIKNWVSDHTIVKEDKKTHIIRDYVVEEVEKSYLDEIHLSKAKVVEGRVYVIINGYGYNITPFARQEAKSLYKEILRGEGG